MSMINISNSAQVYLAKLLKSQKEGTNIRIFAINPGTSQGECGISYCPQETVETNDVSLNFKQFTVYIDEVSAPFLENAEIDLVTDQLESQLVLKAPNIKMNKIQKDLSLKEQVECFLQSTINPQLANHGGYVSLIEITEDGYAIIQFNGRCNGCSMVEFTLKEGIEKQILNEFKNLKGIRDHTNHQYDIHSYYQADFFN